MPPLPLSSSSPFSSLNVASIFVNPCERSLILFFPPADIYSSAPFPCQPRPADRSLPLLSRFASQVSGLFPPSLHDPSSLDLVPLRILMSYGSLYFFLAYFFALTRGQVASTPRRSTASALVPELIRCAGAVKAAWLTPVLSPPPFSS